MKVKNYDLKNGSVDIILANEEEQLCFWNPNIYNRGKWEINSYIKRKNGEDVFNVITARNGKKSYLIKYTSEHYSRIVECSFNNIVTAEIIIFKSEKELYYPNQTLLGSTVINQYIKQNITYHDVAGNIFYGNLSESTNAILDYLQYDKKYTEILSKMETLFKTDLEHLTIKQEQLNVLSKTR